jgi:hypothetical protein
MKTTTTVNGFLIASFLAGALFACGSESEELGDTTSNIESARRGTAERDERNRDVGEEESSAPRSKTGDPNVPYGAWVKCYDRCLSRSADAQRMNEGFLACGDRCGERGSTSCHEGCRNDATASCTQSREACDEMDRCRSECAHLSTRGEAEGAFPTGTETTQENERQRDEE